jgi:hypothetical protein
MGRLATTCFAAALAACATPGPAPAAATATRLSPAAPATPQAAETPLALGRLLLSFERSACEGTCPAYRIDVDVEGVVRYEGRFCVHTLGRAVARLPPEKVEALRAAIARADFSRLAERCCVCEFDDAPTVTITVADPAPPRSVENVCGSEGRAGVVRDLANAIDDVVGTARWTAGDQAAGHCVVSRAPGGAGQNAPA